MIKRLARLMILTLFIVLSGCLGFDGAAVIKTDGSGSLKLTYHLSRLADVMISSGTERQFPLPIEKSDLLRTIGRIDGLELKTYKVEETESDIIIRAELSFKNLSGLTAFLGGPGQADFIDGPKTEHQLRLTFTEGGTALAADFNEAMLSLFKDYSVSFSLQTPDRPLSAVPGIIDAKGRAVFSMPIAELLSATSPVIWEVRW